MRGWVGRVRYQSSRVQYLHWTEGCDIRESSALQPLQRRRP